MMTGSTSSRGSARARARARSSSRLALVVLAVALTAGCASTPAGSGEGPAETTGPSVSAPVSPSATSTPPPEADPCGPATGQEAAAAGIAELPAPAGLEGVPWDAANADYSGYDPCAALSWSLVTLEGGTVSTPTAVLLFHSGSYLGTATPTAYGFTPSVERTADDAISVTYRFPQGSESNAEASGSTVATFRWNADTSALDVAGDFPPAG
jgi:hypothetical protein